MPMPNFHIVHLKPFDEFVPTTVRTEYGGLVFGVQMPEDVFVRYAYHRERKEELPFSIGFPADKYTVDEVVAFLKDAELPYIEVVPASNSEAIRSTRILCARISTVAQQDRFCRIRGGGRARKLTFSGIARTAEPVMGADSVLEYDDVATLRVPSLTLPLDYSHNFDIVVGRVITVRKRGGNLYVRGEIISSRPGDQADEIIDGLLAGRPYQLSIFSTADGKSVVREIHEPDGVHQTPCRVYENYVLRGVAICTYGADAQTKVIAKTLIEEGVEASMSKREASQTPPPTQVDEVARQEPEAQAPDQPAEQPDVLAEMERLKQKMIDLDSRLADLEQLEQKMIDLDSRLADLEVRMQAFAAKLDELAATVDAVANQINATTTQVETIREEMKRSQIPSFMPTEVAQDKPPKEKTMEFFKGVVRKWWLS